MTEEPNTNIIYMKMMSGEDVIGKFIEEDNENIVKVENPIQMIYSPEYGVIGKDWCIYSSENNIEIPYEAILTITPASETGISYYKELISKMIPNDSKSDDDMIQSLLQESLESTKH